MDLSYDNKNSALWVYLSGRAPDYVSLELMHDLLAVDEIAENTLTSAHNVKSTDINFRIMASKRAGIFSLGGDLATFRDLIRDGDRRGLIEYATTAIDAIWSNIRNTAYDDGVTTVALVQGEAQGGGFEAALSAHVLVAEKGAMFGFPEALFGMFPGMGGFQLLSARTSKECAKRLIGSTERYSAEMLYEMGVVDGEGQGHANVKRVDGITNSRKHR